ncbi:MAG: cytochrome c oxidase subunit I, partial [Rhodothermales bacterium]|nr:cytochrome c oxidase subunit I [Rhodothermales bacterium]
MNDTLAVSTGINTSTPKTYLNHDKSVKSWLLTLDHKRIALLYLVTIAIVFLVAGVLALVVRMELFTAGRTIVSADAYNQYFSLHGILMVFGFIIPSVPAIMGNFVMPMQLGAIDVAFPRLNLASYY